jgi:lipid-A-disaccharide synthase
MSSNREFYEIFISAGDFSGDMHAGFLVKNLKTLDENIKITAIGGKFLKDNNINFLKNIVDIQSFGFSGLLKKYFYFKNILSNLILPYFKNNKINLLILVDFYGFNIHLAKLAKKMGIKVVYYICPQVWASRKGRIKNIKKFVDVVIPIFPFQKKIYEDVGINVFYAGNPLIDIIQDEIEKDSQNLIYEENLIGLMPGSRNSEIKNILPIFLELITRLLKKYENDLLDIKNLKFCLIVSKNIDLKFVEKYIQDFNLTKNIEIIIGPSYKIRQNMRFILTSSGTSSFENFLLTVPMMIFYKMDKFSYFIAKLIVKVKYIGMPNILADKMIMPEYIQDINYDELTKTVYSWIKDNEIINDKKRCLSNLKSDLINTNSEINSDTKIIKNIAEYILKISKQS